MECKSCGATIDHRDAFCSLCGELTRSGKPFDQKLKDALFDFGEELSKLAGSAARYVTDGANRKQVVAGGAVVAFLMVALVENPISSGVSKLFEFEAPGPQLTADGLPDFASYSDVFLAEEKQFAVMGTANVRDFPTSQGTKVVGTFSGGEMVFVRQVQAFDPTSHWYKLNTGGYLWGGNLESIDQRKHIAGFDFPTSMQGQWADRNSCTGLSQDTAFSISGNEVDFGGSRYSLFSIVRDGQGIPVYKLLAIGRMAVPDWERSLEKDARWPIIWISYGSDVTGKQYRYFPSHLSCSEVSKISAQM